MGASLVSLYLDAGGHALAAAPNDLGSPRRTSSRKIDVVLQNNINFTTCEGGDFVRGFPVKNFGAATCKFYVVSATCKFYVVSATCKFYVVSTTCKFYVVSVTCKFYVVSATCKFYVVCRNL